MSLFISSQDGDNAYEYINRLAKARNRRVFNLLNNLRKCSNQEWHQKLY